MKKVFTSRNLGIADIIIGILNVLTGNTGTGLILFITGYVLITDYKEEGPKEPPLLTENK